VDVPETPAYQSNCQMQRISSISFMLSAVLFILALCTPIGVSQVVRGAYLRLFAPWTTGIFSYSECCTRSYWWGLTESMATAQVNHFFGLSQYRGARGWTCRKHCFSSLRYDPGGNRTRPTSFGGACSNNMSLWFIDFAM